MRGRKLWWIVLLGIFLAGTAWAQTVRLMPVPPHIKPRWTRVRGSPRVFHAPNVPADVFRGPGGYYLLLDKNWYRSRMLNGPWRVMHRVPPFLRLIRPGYFKNARLRSPRQPPVQATPKKPPAVQPPATAGTAGLPGTTPSAPATPQPGAAAGLAAGAGTQATTPTPTTTTGSTTPTSKAATAMAPAPAPEPIFVYDPGPP